MITIGMGALVVPGACSLHCKAASAYSPASVFSACAAPRLGAAARKLVLNARQPQTCTPGSVIRRGRLSRREPSSWVSSRSSLRAPRNAAEVSTAGTASECGDDERPPFDLNLAVLLAGFAFESYNDPAVTPETPKETDIAECSTIYLSSQFLKEQYSGQLQVKVLHASNCPAMDLWGTSDPYAVVQVGSGTSRTKTAWTTLEPVWKESLSLLIQAKEGGASDSDSLQNEYLRVSLYDAGILRAPRRMGSGALPLANLVDGARHECSVQMEGPGGGATVYLEVQYKSYEQLEEEERRRWRFPSVAELLPPQLLEAVAVPEQLLTALLPFTSSSASSSPAISTSDFVRSALAAFDAPFPEAVGSLRDSSQRGYELAHPKGDASSSSKDQEENSLGPGDAGAGGIESIGGVIDFARSALQGAGWLGADGEGSEEEGQGSVEKTPGSKWMGTGLDLRSLTPSNEVRRRKEELKQELISAGLAAADDEGEEEREKVEGSEGGWGTEDGFSEIRKAVFGQTESLLGWLAVLGAAKESAAPWEEKGTSDGPQAGSSPQGSGSLLDTSALQDEVEAAADTMTEEQQQAMKAVFGKAETAVEAWTILASSLGQQTFVKSEFEKIAFLDNAASDTQLAVWRDVAGRRLAVAFRGTEQSKVKDLLTDISLAPAGLNPERAEGGDFGSESMVHSGFLNAYDSVRPRVLALLKDLTDPSRDSSGAEGEEGTGDGRPWQLLITGHSLGGALATLLAMELSSSRFIRERSIELTMYNFGSPRVGNAVFANEFNSRVKNSWRVVNHRDIIPTVPRLMGYRHVCCPVYLNPLPPRTLQTAKEAAGEATRPGAQEEDGYMGDVIGETTATDLVDQWMGGEEQLFDRLFATEIAMLSALRDGSAISMHMEDFYYIALLKKVQNL